MSHLNDPRVLFAAERTLLAWNRTAIALITLGFVIERFGLFVKTLKLDLVAGQRVYSFYIGIGMISLAIIVSLVATVQFHRFIRGLNAEEIPNKYIFWHSYLINSAVALLAGSLLIYLSHGFNW